MNTLTLNKKITWIDIEKPTENDVDFLRENFNFHELVLNEIIPDTIRTKVDVYDDYFYLVLHFPAFDKATRSTRSQELDILVNNNTIITLHKEAIIPLKSIFDQFNLYEEEKQKYISEADGPAKMLYHLIDSLLNSCFPKLDHISENIDQAERAIFQDEEKNMIREVSIIKRDILDFRRALKPQRQILESLEVTVIKFFGENYKPFFNDLLGHHMRIWDNLENYKELTESLESTNATLFSSKLNETIRILTIFTALLMPISIIVGVFGMNVIVPFQSHPQGFIIILSLATLTILSIYLYFKKKKIF